MTPRPRHIALQFGSLRHFREGLAEYSRRLAAGIAARAPSLCSERNWHFHYILESRWHGDFGPDVHYLPSTNRLRFPHRSVPAFDLWHGLHQHMRFRPPRNAKVAVITVHDFNFLSERRGWRLLRHQRRLWRHLRRADQLIAISALVAADVRRALPWHVPVQVIHNGVADLTAEPRVAVPGLGAGGFLLHISRMSPSKNVEALLRLAAAWPEQHIVLAGPDSHCLAQHRAQCRAADLTNVSILADISDAQKAWLYSECAGFLFPSVVEGFGLPPVEAMNFGKPVFVSKLSALPEVCGDAAVYFDSFDGAAMRACIEGRLHPGAERIALIRTRARHYTWERATDAYLATYAALLDGPPETEFNRN